MRWGANIFKQGSRILTEIFRNTFKYEDPGLLECDVDVTFQKPKCQQPL